MSREDSGINGASESEIWSDSAYGNNVREFWDIAIDRRIGCIGKVLSPRRYSSATTSSIKALNEEKRVLEDTMNVIQRRCAMEEQALQGALEAIRKHLECERHAIARSIATVHHHRNLLVPVMRLPPEILSKIFVFHAQVEDRWLDAALTSTHVCKHWWKIGRGCPELWSYIRCEHCRSAAWMARMIKRSGTVPLSLAMDGRTYVSAKKMAWVVHNMHRFKSLDLSVLPAYDRFFDAFSQPVPLLQSLTISSYERLMFAFPPEFLGGRAPNLRHLKLSTGSYVPWDSGLFAHLTTLDVDGSENPGDGTPPSLEMLLSALRRMPGLETLILCRCLPRPTPSMTVEARVNLSNLKRLEVAAPLARCTRFLRQITINARATVLLNVQCSGVSRTNVEEFFTVFPSHLCMTSPPTARALKFTWRDSFCFWIKVWTVQQHTGVKRSLNTSIRLNFNWDWSSSRGISPLDLTWTCLAAFASPQLHSFRISGDRIVGWDVGVWRKLALMAPNLRVLAPGEAVQSAELCRALSPPDGFGSVPADCCFPELSYLELEAPYDHPMPAPDGGSPLSVVLARSLAARALIGCSTPDLEFVVSRGGPQAPESWSDIFTDAVPGINVHAGQQMEDSEGFMD